LAKPNPVGSCETLQLQAKINERPAQHNNPKGVADKSASRWISFSDDPHRRAIE